MTLHHVHDQFEYSNEFMERIQDLKPQEQEVVKDFWRSLVMRTQRAFSEENGRLHGGGAGGGGGSTANVRSCSCCPYGYHIDLDFVRYCESLATAAAKPSEEQLRRRSRRRSRKSMEFMLGLESLFDQWDAAERVQMVPEAPHEMEPESPKRNQFQTQPLLSSTRFEDEDINNNNNTKVVALSSPPPAAPKRSSSVPRFTYGGMTPSSTSSASSRLDGGSVSSDVFVIPPLRPTNSPPETRAFLRDALDEVCSDFERTLERTSIRRKKAGCGDGGGGGGRFVGVSPAGRGGGSSDRNNNFMTSPCVTQKRSCHTWEEYVDALDSCVSGNKSPRGSRLFTRSATLPLPPSPHKQQQQQQAQQQYESYVQATVAANAATTALQACIPPPPPPRRHHGRLRRSLTPDQLTRSPLSEKIAASLSASPANTDVAATDATTLFNIRQQMALSLKRMKALEEQVKSIPELQNELSQLRDERQRLQSTLQRKEDELQRARDASRLSSSPSPAASPKYASPLHFTPQRISPITLESLGARMRTNSTSSERQLKATLKRDVATMCLLHATRDVAIGTPLVTYRSVGSSPLQKISPTEDLYTRGELDDHAENALRSHKEKQLKKLISIGTQMYVPKRDVRDMTCQTVVERPVQTYSVSVSVKPATRESFVTCKPDVRSVGCSEDRVSDILCKQCVVSKRSVACGTEVSLIQGEAGVSLKLLDMPGRSKTFSLGDNEKLPLVKRKSVGTQYTPFMVHSAGAQTMMTMVHSVGVQNVPEVDNSATQSDAAELVTRQTDTCDLVRLCTSQTVREEVISPAALPPKVDMRSNASNTEIPKTTETGVNTARPAALRNAACNTQQVATRDFGCGDIVKPHISIACADNYCDSCKDAIKHLAKDFTKLPPPSPVSPRAADSRIPRPTLLTSPSPVRKKFQRQNTYTITPSPTPSPSPVAERRNILSTLHEKSTIQQLNKPAAVAGSELSSERKPNISPRSRTISTGSRIAELESIFTKKPIKTYELSQGALDENLIVKEEKCVRINWAREATPTKSRDSLSYDQMSTTIAADRSPNGSSPEEEEDEEEDEEQMKQEKDVPLGARPKNATPQKSSQSDFSVTTNLSVGEEMTTTSVPRERMEPSEELYVALKVVNESLRKTKKSSSMSNNLTAAKSTVQQEWFRVASAEFSRPEEVRDYLDAFRAFSVSLLEYCVNMMDSNGNTVLHYAVSHGNFGVVSLLLDSKVCNVNQMNNAGYTSVMLVSLAKLKEDAHRSVVQRLFRMADINAKAKKHSQTALMLAVSHGNRDMVEMLLAAGADINIQDDDGSTALMCSAEHERLDIVKLLLSQPECDSLKQDVDGSTAFKIAWQAGHRDVGLLLYMHEQMLRSKLQQRGGDSGSSRTPSLSPRNHKRQPSQ